MNDPWTSTTGGFAKIAALVGFVGVLLAPAPEGLTPAAQRLAAVTVLMAVLWVSQAIHIAATSLIPLVAFPLLGIQTAADVSRSYMNQNVMLFLGGFIIALGIEKWGLHRRIALHIVRLLGTSLKRVVLGFMLATAFLSMWISNTASTLLMLPIGLAMLTSLKDVSGRLPPCEGGIEGGRSERDRTTRPPGGVFRKGDSDSSADGLNRFAVILMLSIAYSASIGGFMTLVGTPTNVQFQQIWATRFPEAPRLSAGEWMTAFVPVGCLFLFCAWGLLSWRLPRLSGTEGLNRRFFTERLRALGPPSRAEILMSIIFAVTALLWIFRTPFRFGETPLLPGWGAAVETFLLRLGTEPELAAEAVHDSTVAVGMALLMFFIPADRDDAGRVRPLMDWATAERLPWGILLLFGGGFALADAFAVTGLSEWMGTSFAGLVDGAPPWLLVGAVCLLMTFLTELTSNVATLSTVLPILAGTAVSLGIDPRLIMIPATISTSCAFMLPIATPPNAIIFGSGKVRMSQMARHGILLNLLGVALVTAATFVFLQPQLGLSFDGMPSWATPID